MCPIFDFSYFWKKLVLFDKNSKNEEIVINTSMRMCDDCHKFFCVMSEHMNRKIQCNDTKKCHIFENGKCIVCEEYGFL